MLREGAGFPRSLLLTLAVIAGVSVANLYYNQPLLNLMRDDLDTTDFRANQIAMVTQRRPRPTTSPSTPREATLWGSSSSSRWPTW